MFCEGNTCQIIWEFKIHFYICSSFNPITDFYEERDLITTKRGRKGAGYINSATTHQTTPHLLISYFVSAV